MALEDIESEFQEIPPRSPNKTCGEFQITRDKIIYVQVERIVRGLGRVRWRMEVFSQFRNSC